MESNAHKKYVAAWVAADNENFYRAVQLIDSAIKLSPSSTTLWATKAQFLADINENDAAIGCAEKSADLDSHNEHAWVLLGLLQLRNGCPRAAIEAYNRALLLNRSFNTLTLLAVAQLEIDPIKSIEHAQEALKLNPAWEEAASVVREAERRIRGRN